MVDSLQPVFYEIHLCANDVHQCPWIYEHTHTQLLHKLIKFTFLVCRRALVKNHITLHSPEPQFNPSSNRYLRNSGCKQARCSPSALRPVSETPAGNKLACLLSLPKQVGMPTGQLGTDLVPFKEQVLHSCGRSFCQVDGCPPYSRTCSCSLFCCQSEH